MDFKNVRFTKDHEWVRADGEKKSRSASRILPPESSVTSSTSNCPKWRRGEGGAVDGDHRSREDRGRSLCTRVGCCQRHQPALEQHPDLVNQDPFGDGWFVRVKVKDKKNSTR
jgi:glycine cleavage system H protein